MDYDSAETFSKVLKLPFTPAAVKIINIINRKSLQPALQCLCKSIGAMYVAFAVIFSVYNEKKRQ